MKKMILAIAACAALASAGPAFADTIQMNGKLPMYPHATLDPKEASLTPEVIAQGAPLVILTDDSVAKVDGWYKSHAPKECTRQEASTGVKYACPTGSIMIYSKGQTQIAFVPAFPKF
jgi:hypothetical protein